MKNLQNDPLYIQMFSVHGLIRSENLELGRDADTGGQVTYVIELIRYLSRREDVRRVDLFTRLIDDASVSQDYARPVEEINDKCRIIRIQCGGRKYMRKELLWPHMDEYVDKTIKFIKRQNDMPDIVHGHYPDAGYVAMHLSQIFGVPFVFTGHSLGIPKKEKLLADGMKAADIHKKYKIDHRIGVEENILTAVDMIVASTRQEISDQYGIYKNAKLPEYRVIPPGIDIDRFHPYYHDLLPDAEKSELQKYARASLLKELERFLTSPEKPIVLALSRPDKRKNISGLITAYGQDPELQAIANLAVFAGIRKDIDEMGDNEKSVLTEMLLLMDRYDLYGKLAIPKKHDFAYEVPELYRIAADKGGVFINPALTEPFGLTLLEASASGLPIVATDDGGPRDIIANCENGILIDATDTREISGSLKKLLTDEEQWRTCSKNGIMNVGKHYTWDSHAGAYIKAVTPLVVKKGRPDAETETATPIGKRLLSINCFLITDIDNTLIGEDNSRLGDFLEWISGNADTVGFGVATGRTVDSAVEILGQYSVPAPDLIVSSVGTEIYYGRERTHDQGWETHISVNWNRKKIVELLKDFDFLEYQEESSQRPFKASYDMAPEKDRISMIHERLLKHKCRYTMIYSHEKYLDIIPYRASKGKALRYLSYKWETPLSNFIVCGDSGNDEEMMRGEPKGVVVANFSPELSGLKGGRNIYFAAEKCAGGMLEGLQHYGLMKQEDIVTDYAGDS